MAWTEDRVELLKKLWAEGLSASQIANRLGGCTRNAVISKVHRLGLPGRVSRNAGNTRSQHARAAAMQERLKTGRRRGYPLSPISSWSDEEEQELVRLWNVEHLTEAAIGERLGKSKDSINRKIVDERERLGLERRRPPRAKPAAAPIEELIIPISERASIISLTERMCRWPIGDPRDEDFHFCGKSSPLGMPYCEFHRVASIQPAQPRRARSAAK